jgi:5-hydroxyisourate hydrolase
METSLSTHVLDTARGAPAAGIAIELYALSAAGDRALVATAVTDGDGRAGTIGGAHPPGDYELLFRVDRYFAGQGVRSFYGAVPVRFIIGDTGGKYHVPLLLSPWGYSTYRGS